MRPGVADDLDEPVRDVIRGSRSRPSRSRARASRRRGSPSSRRSPRYACSTDSTPEKHESAGCEKPGHGRGHGAGREQRRPSRASTPMVRFAPAPSGTACRRTSSGVSTTSTSGSSRFSSSASHVPWKRIVSPAARTCSPGRSSPSALDGENDEIAAVGDHPGEDGLADQAGARRNDDLGDPGARVRSVSAASSISYWSTSVRA